MHQSDPTPNRVVIIDDDPRQLELLSLIGTHQRSAWQIVPVLADVGNLARLREDPLAAVGRPALILLDANLGSCRAEDLLPGLSALAPVVVLCGTRAGVDVEACRRAGGSAVLGKPFDVGEVAQVLQACDDLLVRGDDDA